MAIPSRGFRFFRRAARRVESEKHRSPTSVGGLRRGHVSDLAFHVKRFTPIHLVLAQQVGKEEVMGEPRADGEDNKRWARRRKGAARTLSLGVHSGLVILWKVRKFVATRLLQVLNCHYFHRTMHYVKTFFRLLLGVFMTYAGYSHLTFNRLAFVAQVPMWLRFSDGFTDFVVVASGVVEIALGLAMLFPFRHKAKVGALLALFYVLIFPGNLNQYFYHIDSFGLVTDTQRLIRLFFQPVLIALALWSTGGWSEWKAWWRAIRGR